MGKGSSSGSWPSNKVSYVQVDLPDSMIKAIKIIERLLTQAQYHEQHVLYKNYPSAKIDKKGGDDDEDDESKRAGFSLGRGKPDKKQEEDKKLEVEDDGKEGQVSIAPLFKFECD